MRISDWSSDGCSSDLLLCDPAEPLSMSNGKDENTVENGILALPETGSATGLFSMPLLIQPSDPRNRPLFPFDRTWSGPAEAISELLADHNLPLGTHHPKWLL